MRSFSVDTHLTQGQKNLNKYIETATIGHHTTAPPPKLGIVNSQPPPIPGMRYA